MATTPSEIGVESNPRRRRCRSLRRRRRYRIHRPRTMPVRHRRQGRHAGCGISECRLESGWLIGRIGGKREIESGGASRRYDRRGKRQAAPGVQEIAQRQKQADEEYKTPIRHLCSHESGEARRPKGASRRRIRLSGGRRAQQDRNGMVDGVHQSAMTEVQFSERSRAGRRGLPGVEILGFCAIIRDDKTFK